LLAGERAVPTVATMHGPATGEVGDYHRLLGDSGAVVAISNADARQTQHWTGWARSTTPPTCLSATDGFRTADGGREIA
jgi:hypothetical protein